MRTWLCGSYSLIDLQKRFGAQPGAAEAKGAIILLADDDCVPAPDWLSEITVPFEDPVIVGVKGAYRTRQASLIARFVQYDHEDRYRMMEALADIDFVNTYSAAFRRDHFLELNGYDTRFDSLQKDLVALLCPFTGGTILRAGMRGRRGIVSARRVSVNVASESRA